VVDGCKSKRSLDMTAWKWSLPTAVAALIYGLAATAVLAADEGTPGGDQAGQTANESAKMGKDEGTHTGPNQGATPENDTDKVEQPERRNPTTGGQ
jgi:hypothetical protein